MASWSKLTPLERSMRMVSPEPNSGCWLWMGAVTNGGYGIINIGGRKPPPTRAHRLTYELLVGPIPEGLELDHLCRVPCCVNPKHLEPVTHAENVRRGNAGKNMSERTHCPKGHPRTKGARRCKECHRDSEYNRRRTAGLAVRVPRIVATVITHPFLKKDRAQTKLGAPEFDNVMDASNTPPTFPVIPNSVV
jgi:hypothetical protein